MLKYSLTIILFCSLINVYNSNHVNAHPGFDNLPVLHVRNLPAISGFQSNVYEVYMGPYGYTVPAIFAASILRPDGGNADAATGDADEASSAVKGELLFTQIDGNGPVHITGNITGLTEGKHGLHIHEFGDLRQGCASTGEHFNPYLVRHGDVQDPLRHVGDLGNIEANADGLAEVKIADYGLSLFGGPRSIVGRAIVVHEKEDDLGRAGTVDSIKSGSSGKRLACGVIGYVH